MTMTTDNSKKILNAPDCGNAPKLRFPEFSEEYTTKTIGQLTTKVGSGVTPKGGENVYTTEGHPFVRSQNVGNGQMFLEDIAFIDENTHKKQIATEIQKGDVLLNITGASIGRSSVAFDEVVGGNVNQHVCIVRPNREILSHYLCYLFLSDKGQKQIDSFQAGGNRQGLNFEQIKSFKFSIPTLAEQKKVSDLLFLIDERIKTQSRAIEDLKQLKAALVEVLYKQNSTNQRIGDVVVQVSTRNRSGYNYSVLSVNNRLGFIEQSEQFEDRMVASEDTSNYKIVIRNDFAYNPARINVGSIARLTSFENGIVSPMYICFHTKKQILPEYLEYFFDTRYFNYEMQKRLEGSVRLCLSWEGLCNIPIAVPSIEEQRKTSKRVSKIVEKIALEEHYLDLLKAQKQYLLEALFI